MEQRIVDFIAGLRAAGVRVSIAESADAFRAVDHVGVMSKHTFRSALHATLIKDARDGPTFDALFPIYFGSGGPPLLNPTGELTPAEQQMLMDALRQLAGDMRRLMEMLLQGRQPNPSELRQAGNQVGLQYANRPFQQDWFTRRMLRQLGLDQLTEALRELLEQLARQGMSEESRNKLEQAAAENAAALAEQVEQFVGENIARKATEEHHEPQEAELLERPFSSLSEAEAKALQELVRRLAAQLRSRASLRHKKGKRGVLDAKRTIRANQRYGAVPMEIYHKTRHLKPKLALICDVSTSVRYCSEFMLRLIYELQDQVSKARSFVFIGDIKDITAYFDEDRPDVAVERVLEDNQPGYYNTNLGNSLATFAHDHLDTVDHRTTLIVISDGRNNFSDPRVDLLEMLKRRARRIIWLSPEPPYLWGTGDSDMPQYVGCCDAVHEVGNLQQLADAVDKLLD
ncbi:MAG: VWA domain-containing protein [Chloroflexi bacterium]|nr:VWA domain-containing protein [Chloroflexota bacterium]MBI3732369.1 VWA domain-containing protein [Chloroflexota bacterium]